MTVRATIVNGISPTQNYVDVFTVDIYVPVTKITYTGPTFSTPGNAITLSGTVVPANASQQNIVWTLVNKGGTDATLAGNTLSTTAASNGGTVIVRATIADGEYPNKNYAQDFTIPIVIPVTGITGVPTTMVLKTSTPQYTWYDLTLTGVVSPANAKQTIVWEVASVTGVTATIAGNTLSVAAATGLTKFVTVRARVVDGVQPGVDYTQQFTINCPLN